MFLGKLRAAVGDEFLTMGDDGRLGLGSAPAVSWNTTFIVDSIGAERFVLRDHLGGGVRLEASKSPIAWYPVLTYAGDGSPTYFHRGYLDVAKGLLSLIFDREDNGQPVGLICTPDGFDVGTGPSFATTFRLSTVAPGIPQIQASRSASNCDFGKLGRTPVDLSGTSFFGVDFRGSSFEDAILDRSSFSGCSLNNARLRRAHLSDTDFTGAVLAGADMSDCDLRERVKLPNPVSPVDAHAQLLLRNSLVPSGLLGRNWSMVDLTGARVLDIDRDLTRLVARNTTMPGIQLSSCLLDGADLSNSDLSGADLAYARLNGVTAVHCRLTGADLSNCEIVGAQFGVADDQPDTHPTELTEAILNGVRAENCNFRGIVGRGATFTGAVLTDIDFHSAELAAGAGRPAASFTYAFLENVRLDSADLTGVSLAFTTVIGTAFGAAGSLERTDFTNAYLTGANFTGANLRGARLIGACLLRSSFVGADLTPAGATVPTSLVGAALQGAAFDKARLDAADLTNAAVNFVPVAVPVRRCTAARRVQPEPPNVDPVTCQPTTGLDADTLLPTTVCPDGFTYAENQRLGRTIVQMLTSTAAPQSWFATSCGPARIWPSETGAAQSGPAETGASAARSPRPAQEQRGRDDAGG